MTMKETVVASVALVIASTMNISAMEPLHQENGFVLSFGDVYSILFFNIVVASGKK